ncbi:MAG: AraC family transcriptional regulator [Bacteroidota bacterium]
MIYLILLNIAIFQGIVLGIVILKSKAFRTKANAYLAYLILVLSFLLTNPALDLGGAYHHFPFLVHIHDVETAFLVPAFLLLFILNKGEHPLKNSKRLIWLFLPFGYAVAIDLFRLFNAITRLYTAPETIAAILDILNTIELVLALVFIPATLGVTYTFLKHITQEKERSWIRILWFLVSFTFFSWVIAILVRLVVVYDISLTMKLTALAVTFFIHWTSYVGLYRLKLLGDRLEIKTVPNGQLIKILGADSVQDVLINKEPFDSNNQYFKKLETLFNEEKIFADHTLDREKVAKELGISSGYLSQIINGVTGDSFSSYLNHYRVEAVKKMILNSEFDNYSLLAIGLESGFTSKTTFHKVFKKHTGMTPRHYREANK